MSKFAVLAMGPVLALFLSGPVLAQEADSKPSNPATEQPDTSAAGKSAEQIRACSRANLPQETLTQTLELNSVDRSGGERLIRTMFYLKDFGDQTRATLQVRAPIDLNGVSYLMIDRNQRDQLYLYLPSVRRVRRVSGNSVSNSMLGTDFSYEDIKQLRAVAAGGKLIRLADDKVAERPVYTLGLRPAPEEESAYQRIVFKIDRETCVTLQIEFFGSEADPLKRLTADPDSLEKIGDRWLARRLTMHDLRAGSHTTMQIIEIEYDEGVPGSIFNSRTFYLGAYLPHGQSSSRAG